MDLKKVVVNVDGNVVIIDGDALPVIGKATDPAIALAAARIFEGNPTIQVEQGGVRVLVVHG